jgi:hypothetical protein
MWILKDSINTVIPCTWHGGPPMTIVRTQRTVQFLQIRSVTGVFFFFPCGTGVWIQGLTLARQALLPLELLYQHCNLLLEKGECGDQSCQGPQRRKLSWAQWPKDISTCEKGESSTPSLLGAQGGVQTAAFCGHLKQNPLNHNRAVVFPLPGSWGKKTAFE